jgi:repressor LexA
MYHRTYVLIKEKIMPISEKRKRVLDFITAYIEEKNYPPSLRDIGKGCGISSTSVVQYYMKVLERDGFIHRDHEVSRGITVTRKHSGATVPLLGTIAAGQPIPVPSADTWTATPEETIELPGYLGGDLTNIYALKVKGTSMIDALIDNGDIVIMQSANTAANGETVAIWLKDRQEVTLKKIYHEADRIRLQPANTLMQPIYSKPENIEVQGKLIAVLRKVGD